MPVYCKHNVIDQKLKQNSTNNLIIFFFFFRFYKFSFYPIYIYSQTKIYSDTLSEKYFIHSYSLFTLVYKKW